MRTLPTAAQFTVVLSPGFALNGNEVVAALAGHDGPVMDHCLLAL